MNEEKVAILGGGFAGMAAARTLADLNCTVYEAREHAGGHSSSYMVGDKFTFDEGPHVSFTPNDRVCDFLSRSVGNEYFEYELLQGSHSQASRPVQSIRPAG